jgi:exonuclease V
MQRQHHDPVSAATMSDDEFGYDFETDDEELLIQLASDASLPLKQSTDAVALIAAASAAEKTVAGIKASQEVKAFHEQVYPRDALALTPGNEGKAPEVSVRNAERKRAPPSASPAHDTVAYPDCEQEFDFTILD